MNQFITRIKNALNYDACFDREPLYFQALIVFIFFWSLILKAIFVTVAFLTVPIWFLPYFVHSVLKQKHKDDKR